MIDKNQVKLHFSRNASNYNKYTYVQKNMRDTLINLLFEGKEGKVKIKRILEIGCGTGYLTTVLLEIFPKAHITAVDISSGMICEIKSKIKNDCIDFICGDIEDINIDTTYDIIISNATFQWLNHIELTLEKLYKALNKNGVLCFSTFGRHTFIELNECFKKARQIMGIKEPIYSGQTFFSLNELDGICKEVTRNKNLIRGKEIFEYEYFRNCREFFYSIKKTGASNSNKEGRCTSPAFIRKVIKLYNENFKENNKVKATYHCLFYKMIKNV